MSAAEDDALDVFIVTLQKQGVLLPRDNIAEIIPYEPLQRMDDTPDWLLGVLGWRGEQVPVVSFEMLSVERASFSLVSVSSASLVIVRATSDPSTLRFYALVSQTEPKFHQVSGAMLFETGEPVERTELAKVRYNNDVLSIPNLDYIEAALLNALVQ